MVIGVKGNMIVNASLELIVDCSDLINSVAVTEPGSAYKEGERQHDYEYQRLEGSKNG